MIDCVPEILTRVMAMTFSFFNKRTIIPTAISCGIRNQNRSADWPKWDRVYLDDVGIDRDDRVGDVEQSVRATTLPRNSPPGIELQRRCHCNFIADVELRAAVPASPIVMSDDE